MTDDKMGGKIRRPKGRASVDDTESFLTAMHPSLAPETRDRLAVVTIGVPLKIASRPRRTRSSQPFDRQALSLVAGRQLNSVLARVAFLTVCEGGEPSVNAICA